MKISIEKPVRILVEDGDVFDGNWQQLDDCFGLRDEAELQSWCEAYGWSYTIEELS